MTNKPTTEFETAVNPAMLADNSSFIVKATPGKPLSEVEKAAMKSAKERAFFSRRTPGNQSISL